MIDSLTYDGKQVHVHAGDGSLKTTKAFTHGSIVFDTAAQGVVFAQMPAVPIPTKLALRDGAELEFQLVAPDGTLRKQTRSGTLRMVEKQPHLFRVAGRSKTPRNFPAEQGWGNAIYKYRCYFTHPGFYETSPGGFQRRAELPEWLKGSIGRQKALWNRLAWLCREARRKCSPVPPEEIVDFVQHTILPAIDEFNQALGRSRDKMKHPPRLKIEMPGLDGIWKFVGELRGRINKGRPVPAQLLERTVDFAQRYHPDYTPLNEFLNRFPQLAENEAVALGLRRFEIRPTVTAFRAVLTRRKSMKTGWSQGWPLIKYPDSPRSDNWGLHYYLNKAGVACSLLETEKGVPGLTFGPPRKRAASPKAGVRSERILREAEISIAGDGKEPWKFRFVVMQHRPLPPDSHIKEWKLLLLDGKLWLCLVIELKRPLPAPGPMAAGLDIGWRRTEEGIRFGTLYEPETDTMRELVIDLQRSPRDHKDRAPFCIDLGPQRCKSGRDHKVEQKNQIAKLFPEWQASGMIPNPLETRGALQKRRDHLKDAAKRALREILGEQVPPWLDKAGRHGLIKLNDEIENDPRVQQILNPWLKADEQIGRLLAAYTGRLTQCVEYGQMSVAHDVCRYLQQKGVGRVVVEKNFLAKVAQKHDEEDPVALKRSQKYRQLVAVGRFVGLLKNTAVKYGITVETCEAMNTTRVCQHCNHLNDATEKEQYQCAACGRLIKQDHNAAVNLSRFGSDPELAKMALEAGRKPKQSAA